MISLSAATSPSSTGRQPGRNRGADQEGQRVFIEGHLARVSGDVHPRRIHPGLGLTEIEIGGGTDFSAPPDHFVGRLLGLEGRLGKLQVLAVGGKGQPGVGHLGHKRDLRAHAGLLRGKVLLERRILQAPDAAEQVQLPGADAQIDIVQLYRSRLTGLREDAGHPLLACGTGSVHRREEFGPLNAVQGLRSLDVQRRHAQVAVVGERQVDDLP